MSYFEMGKYNKKSLNEGRFWQILSLNEGFNVGKVKKSEVVVRGKGMVRKVVRA